VHRPTAATIVCVLAGAGLHERAVAGEKSGYWLFNPTPVRLMREMTTDRPDITEVPFTVDAGHIQIESTVFGYARARADLQGAESDIYELAYTNVRLGLTNDVELSVIWQPYGLIDPQGDIEANASGVGAIDLRLKANLWGNDNFEKIGSAFALLPFAVVPTDADNGISLAEAEGGIAAFLQVKLPDKLEFGMNAAIAAVADEVRTGYHAEYPISASLSYEWTAKLGTYVEVAAVLGLDDPRGDLYLAGAGWTYAASDNLQLDGGINFGFAAPAARYNPFVGLSMRF
jgi:hypothetical protein